MKFNQMKANQLATAALIGALGIGALAASPAPTTRAELCSEVGGVYTTAANANHERCTVAGTEVVVAVGDAVEVSTASAPIGEPVLLRTDQGEEVRVNSPKAKVGVFERPLTNVYEQQTEVTTTYHQATEIQRLDTAHKFHPNQIRFNESETFPVPLGAGEPIVTSSTVAGDPIESFESAGTCKINPGKEARDNAC